MIHNNVNSTYPCLRAKVLAVLSLKNGDVIVEQNRQDNEVKECPRNGYPGGKGYHLCKEVCGQSGHGEELAIKQAINLYGEKALDGARLVIFCHRPPCENCSALISKYNIESEVVIVPEFDLMNTVTYDGTLITTNS